ncbi:MAG TPA: hypothetical protein VFY20_05095 [Gemmatimonadales bacterium]|nr:hypothetical protein [Gemmatimonadales bacterium]
MCRSLRGLMLLAGVVLAGCGRSSEEWVMPTPAAESGGTEIQIVGTIRRIELEGGFFAIRGDDGITYDPMNLPAAFEKDGLAIEAEARRRDDVAGIHMVGPIVELVRIRSR